MLHVTTKALSGLFFIAVFLLAGCAHAPDAGLQACTEEAKLCPDGSAVGRTGPDCAFAPCPNASCAKEGEYTSGGKVVTDPHVVCCADLEAFDTRPLDPPDKSYLCYDPAKGAPACGAVGTRSEGWYYAEPQALLRYDNCAGQ